MDAFTTIVLLWEVFLVLVVACVLGLVGIWLADAVRAAAEARRQAIWEQVCRSVGEEMRRAAGWAPTRDGAQAVFAAGQLMCEWRCVDGTQLRRRILDLDAAARARVAAEGA